MEIGSSNINVVKARFEWDPSKADGNLRKHGVDFETASLVFADPNALIEQDRIVGGEERWRAIGIVDGRAMLLVAHTATEGRDGAEIIRIISARPATRRERSLYEEDCAL